jgi:hypothetical protein
MFERSFLWTMRNGSRLLFACAVLMLLAGAISFFLSLRSGGILDQELYNLLYGYLTPAAYLLFGAVLTHRLDRSPDGES